MIAIRPAGLAEKHKTYAWLCLSDTTPLHMGEPDFPESPVPDWEQFQADFEDFYYLPEGKNRGAVMIVSDGAEEIGCLCYACFHLRPRRAELDIWLKDRAHCGRGLGTMALVEMVKYLRTVLGIEHCFIRPSEKNLRAIRAYEKAGFARVPDKRAAVEEFLLSEYLEQYGEGDYGEAGTAVLTLG